MLSRQLKVLISFSHFCLEVRNCVGVVVRKFQGCLQLGCPGNDILGEVSAPAQKFLFLFMGVSQGPVDSLILNPNAVQGLVRTQTGEYILEL